MNDLDLLHQTLGKMKHKKDVPPEFHFIEGGDHSFKVKGGKAANEKSTTTVLKICVDWCKKIFGISTDQGSEEVQEDALATNTSEKKRKRPSDEADSAASTATNSPTKKSKTLETYFSKPQPK
jgi:hypothetical protein